MNPRGPVPTSTAPSTASPTRAGRGLRIASAVDDLEEGLFGQVLLWVFEILPWLARTDAAPDFRIHSPIYGTGPDRQVLPGVFDLAYAPPARATRTRSLLWARVLHTSVLGGDWHGTHALWTRYFRVPARIEARADAVGLPAHCLGLHYRGTDKNKSVDTNPVDADDFLALVEAFLAGRPDLRAVFIASDEPGMLARVARRFPRLDVRGLGDVAFHKGAAAAAEAGQADRALLDCVLLSRCAVVLKCSSALSSFAKVLNPALECYRVAACRMFIDVPYFPDAYIPRLELPDAASRAILARQFDGDWLDNADARARWGTPFVARPRHTAWGVVVNAAKYVVTYALRGRPRRA